MKPEGIMLRLVLCDGVIKRYLSAWVFLFGVKSVVLVRSCKGECNLEDEAEAYFSTSFARILKFRFIDLCCFRAWKKPELLNFCVDDASGVLVHSPSFVFSPPNVKDWRVATGENALTLLFVPSRSGEKRRRYSCSLYFSRDCWSKTSWL